MDPVPTQVVIPFHPLLERITTALHFPHPVYQFVDASKNNVCVSVKADCGPIAYIYVGGEAGKVEESCEKAAQKTVHDLMKKYEVYVEDVTSIKRQMFDRCATLYNLKRAELDRIEKGLPKIALHEPLSDNESGSSKYVSVDFMSILRVVFRTLAIRCTPIETIEHNPEQYTSWLTMTPPKSKFAYECIFGDCCCTLAAAKQSLAKKVLFYCLSAYNLEIVNANYNPTTNKFDALMCTLARESYLNQKERVLGIKESLEPSLLLVEQDCLTPRGAAFQIPSTVSSPLPPKKRKPHPIIANPSVVAPSGTELPLDFMTLPELDTVFKRSKFV
ncbi:hypothetical protein BVRB_1g009880 [Beta vulgaris subsp. vulgaris]|nr:hypothetical protein BVRB_1g009880 [Beta vulgaris subsp. vulgaris]